MSGSEFVRIDATVVGENITSEFLDVFRQEAAGHLESIVGAIRTLTKEHGRRDALDEARRVLHTLKGAAGVIGLRRASGLAHEIEDLVDQIFDGTGDADPTLHRRLWEASDALAESCGLAGGPKIAVRSVAGPDGWKDRRLGERRTENQAIRYVRVPVDYLDELARLSAELSAESAFDDAQRRRKLSLQIRDCLDRMQRAPVASIAARLRRTVSVTCQSLGKHAALVLEGITVEMDRAVLDELAGPLEHLLRNAIVHGIESPDAREISRKGQVGQIHVRAFLFEPQAGRQRERRVVLEVADDGAGMDAEAILRNAITTGIVGELEAELLNEEAVLDLAFSSGLSTTPEVSEASGRGMGLAAVKDAVDRLGGLITVETRPGVGTTFRIELPQSLGPSDRAKMQVMEVAVRADHYALPMNSVTAVLRSGQAKVERIAGKPWLRHGGEWIPMVGLESLLHGPDGAGEIGDVCPVAIIEVLGRRVGVAVDELGMMRRATVESLGGVLRRVHGVVGATVDDDKGVVLILDAATLCQSWLEKMAESTPDYLPGTTLSSIAS